MVILIENFLSLYRILLYLIFQILLVTAGHPGIEEAVGHQSQDVQVTFVVRMLKGRRISALTFFEESAIGEHLAGTFTMNLTCMQLQGALRINMIWKSVMVEKNQRLMET